MTDGSIEAVRRKTRLRLTFTGVHLLLYFSFTLNWTAWGTVLGDRLGATQVTGSLLMFVLLVCIFIVLETIFLVITQRSER